MSAEPVTALSIAAEGVWRGNIFCGRWQPARGGTGVVIEPATGRPLTEVGMAAVEDVREAARTAASVQEAWAGTPAERRAGILRRAAQLLETHAESLRSWIVRETGCIPGKADVELHLSAAILWEAAALATQPHGVVLPSSVKRMSFARRVPHGVVGVISAFNFPLILTMRALAPALALGNAVVCKPDPRTPISGGFIPARLFEAAGLPAGLLHVLPGGGEVGEALVIDPAVAMVSFTGSSATGRRVGELASRHLKKVALELGGKNATIVLEDADLDVAASNVAWGSFLHQGQICMATGKVLAHRSILEPLVQRLVQKARQLPVGDPHTQDVALGPLINEQQVRRVQEMVDEAVARGAKLHAGGSHDRLFYKPTVITGVDGGNAPLRRGGVRSGAGGDPVRQRRGGDRAAQRQPVRAVGRRDHPVAGTGDAVHRAAAHRHRAHQRPVGGRRALGPLRRPRRLRQRLPPRRHRQLGRVHPVAMGHGAGPRHAVPVLTRLTAGRWRASRSASPAPSGGSAGGRCTPTSTAR